MNGWNKCILDMENTTVENNTAYVGAGMLFHYSILKYKNGLIRYNRAISRAGKSAPSTMNRTRHDDSSKVGPSGSAYLQNDQPNENIKGIAGGTVVDGNAVGFCGGSSALTLSKSGSGQGEDHGQGQQEAGKFFHSFH